MKYLISILIGTFFSLGMFAQDNSSRDSIIGTLEQRILTLENQKELLDGKFELQKGELENQFATYKNEVDPSIYKIDSFFWLMGVLGFISFIGMLITIGSIFWYARSRAKKEVDNKLGAIFDENRDQISSLIKKESLEKKLKAASKLLVVHSDIKHKGEVKDILREANFPDNNIEFKNIKEEVPSLEDYHLIIQAIGEDVEDTDIQKYLDLDEKYFVVYFKGRKAILNSYRHNSSIANSKFTLYHHIMNTLKYMDSSDR